MFSVGDAFFFVSPAFWPYISPSPYIGYTRPPVMHWPNVLEKTACKNAWEVVIGSYAYVLKTTAGRDHGGKPKLSQWGSDIA